MHLEDSSYSRGFVGYWVGNIEGRRTLVVGRHWRISFLSDYSYTLGPVLSLGEPVYPSVEAKVTDRTNTNTELQKKKCSQIVDGKKTDAGSSRGICEKEKRGD